MIIEQGLAMHGMISAGPLSVPVGTVFNVQKTLTKAQFNSLNSSPFLLVTGETDTVMLPVRLCVELTTLAGATFTPATLTVIHDGIPGFSLMQGLSLNTTVPLTTLTGMSQSTGAIQVVSVRGLGLRLLDVFGNNDANIAQANVFLSHQKFKI